MEVLFAVISKMGIDSSHIVCVVRTPNIEANQKYFFFQKRDTKCKHCKHYSVTYHSHILFASFMEPDGIVRGIVDGKMIVNSLHKWYSPTLKQ